MMFRRILVPVDFSERSSPALTYALSLARIDGAEIEILHVVPPPGRIALAIDAYTGRPMPHESEAVVLDAREQMESLVSSIDHRDVTLHSRIEPGDPAATIVRLATEDAVDLIVMTTHGRVGLAEFLLGSVTKTLISCAPCPVVTLRAQA
jgi:nucleotide-binding universal stress UspA family protein